MCNRIEEFSPLEILRIILLTFVRDIFYTFYHRFSGVRTKSSLESFQPHDFLIFISMQWLGTEFFLQNQTVVLRLFKLGLVYTLYNNRNSRTLSIGEIKQVTLTKHPSELLRFFLSTDNWPTRSWHLPIFNTKKIKALKKIGFKVRFIYWEVLCALI